MKFGSLTRGHENVLHVTAKKSAAELALAGGADAVMFELAGCDVLAVKRTRAGECRVAIEVETSARNAVRNIKRDFGTLDCLRLVVVTPSIRVKTSILAHLRKRLPASVLRNVFVVHAGDISDACFRSIFEKCPGANKTPREEMGGGTDN
jgi:hypothetical protein